MDLNFFPLQKTIENCPRINHFRWIYFDILFEITWSTNWSWTFQWHKWSFLRFTIIQFVCAPNVRSRYELDILTYCLTLTNRVRRSHFLNYDYWNVPIFFPFPSNLSLKFLWFWSFFQRRQFPNLWQSQKSLTLLTSPKNLLPYSQVQKISNPIHKSKKPLTLFTSHCHLIFSTCNFRFFIFFFDFES